MKKIVVFAAMAAMAICSFAASGNLRYTVMVNKFENKANWTGR